MSGKKHVGWALLALCVGATMIAAPADARRGGSFGSRGSRTYASPSSTSLAPGYAQPVARSMTARPAYQPSQYAPSSVRPSYNPISRPRFGFGGGLLTGIVAGGLIGAMMGHGWGGGYGGGGGGGMLALLIQLAILGGIGWFVLRLFRGGSTQPPQQFGQYDRPAPLASDPYAASAPYGISPAAPVTTEIALTDADQDLFERLLIELQDAFGAEDYARLRSITTPEIMSFLAEELSDNATHGRRNSVTATRLLDGEISEAWHEADADYATIAMRYESIDVMKDRSTGAVLSGDPQPTETTELWTFVRPAGGWSAWKVSAIQET